MLKLVYRIQDLSLSNLTDIYQEENIEIGKEIYESLSPQEQLLRAEQDFREYICDFMKPAESFYALWLVDNRYIAALRMEPYQDGFLLAGLETIPDARHHGYASMLVKATLSYMESQGKIPVYSHIHNKNAVSRKIHCSCGFREIMPYAVYVNGSVSQNCRTFCYFGLQELPVK